VEKEEKHRHFVFRPSNYKKKITVKLNPVK
jgi:hypothetical protein